MKMKIRVKLFGQLKKKIPAYQNDQGLELELPERAKVGDLLSLLNITDPKTTTAIVNGRVLTWEENLPRDSVVNLFYIMFGG
jgi:sulfur carrier protein ThiS